MIRSVLCNPDHSQYYSMKAYALTGNQPYVCHELYEWYCKQGRQAKGMKWLERGVARGEPQCVLIQAK